MTHHATAKRWLKMFCKGYGMWAIGLMNHVSCDVVENAIRDELNRRDKKR